MIEIDSNNLFFLLMFDYHQDGEIVCRDPLNKKLKYTEFLRKCFSLLKKFYVNLTLNYRVQFFVGLATYLQCNTCMKPDISNVI